MKGILLPQRSDAELAALYHAEASARQRYYYRRRRAIAQFREAVGAALTLLPGMPVRAEELLSEAVTLFDKEMNDA